MTELEKMDNGMEYCFFDAEVVDPIMIKEPSWWASALQKL